MKRLLCFILPLLIVPLFSTQVYAQGTRPVNEEPAFQAFQYVKVRGAVETVPAPAAYRAAQKADAVSMKTELTEPVDICTEGGQIFIADKGGNRVICTDSEFNVIKIINEFVHNGKLQTLSEPEGVYATGNKLYIADTGNKRIVVLDSEYNTAAVINAPSSEMFSEDLVFSPVKVAADAQGRVYAVVRGVYEGIMELYEDGSFGGFVGSIPVSPDPLTLFWKNFMTKEQRDKLESFVPVEYTNLMIDSEGFIYTVSLSSENQNSIRRLNAAGDDILNRSALGGIPSGGAYVAKNDSKAEASDFVDIAVDENGLYFALDSRHGRIFSYDNQGNLLFAFGGKNTGQNGTFEKPASIASSGSRIFVLDSGTASVTVFEQTEYARLVLRSGELYKDDKFEESIESWREVLRYNNNFVIGYSKIGQAFYQLERYGEAMEYFKKALDQPNYSKAFARRRGELFTDNFALIIGGLIAAIAALFVLIKLLAKFIKRHMPKSGGIVDSLRNIFFVITHPFDGFWDLKHEKRGKLWVAVLMVLLTVITFALNRGLSGFAVAAVPDARLDIIFELKFVLVPLALFVVANMSVTTLMDGKGTLKQIFTASGYALTPLVLIITPLTLISNLFTQNELMYSTVLLGIAIIWTALLIFAALLSTHEYTAGKTVATVALTAAAMLIICFISVLFFSLFSELVGFAYTIIEEVRFR